MFEIDPNIVDFQNQVYNTPLIQDVWKDKYLQTQKGEKYPSDAYARVAKAISNSPVEKNPGEAYNAFYDMLSKRLFLPGGRILAGAGTAKRVTLMNCYVNVRMADSIEGIAEGKKNLMVTSSMGGGMGTSFSSLRPKDAVIERLGTGSSGVVSFMDTFNADGKTIRSAGERRAAQMGTLIDTHPDLPDFIVAKGEGLKDGSLRLKEFNVSVWVSDAFKSAVDDDEDWALYFHLPPTYERSDKLKSQDFTDDKGVKQYVYSIWRARELWDLITRYTYEFSDPGIIFGDRVNELNNLSYCEYIDCTNPCGEQPLPPNGTCNLGAINLANCVKNPFTQFAEFDFELVAEVATWGVRFLDNVIDVTRYPLKEQEEEERAKRRIGLGITGLATMFAEMQTAYGSKESVALARKIQKTIAFAAYKESMRLAVERGAFPLFDDIIVECGFIEAKFDDDFKEEILTNKLRNGVLLTVAPTGTTSIAAGNISSGLEPEFAHEIERNVRQNNSEDFKKYTEFSYTKRFYEFCTGSKTTPSYMNVASDLSILDHIKVQAAIQEWTDASTSKTINVPQNTSYEEFVEVYELAFQYGLKGTTTYRHSPYRESILSAVGEVKKDITVKRPQVLSGNTYKLKWPSMNSSMFVTINYLEDRPYEIFFASKDAKYQDWMTGLTLMISAILRSHQDPSVVVRDLKQVVSTNDINWDGGKFYGSLPARIAHIIEEDFIAHGILQSTKVSPQLIFPTNIQKLGETCPECRAPTFVFEEGCGKCLSCGYSKC